MVQNMVPNMVRFLHMVQNMVPNMARFFTHGPYRAPPFPMGNVRVLSNLSRNESYHDLNSALGYLAM